MLDTGSDAPKTMYCVPSLNRVAASHNAICLAHTENMARYQLGNTIVSLTIKRKRKVSFNDIIHDYALRNIGIIPPEKEVGAVRFDKYMV